jgi:hypothetical protein
LPSQLRAREESSDDLNGMRSKPERQNPGSSGGPQKKLAIF